MAEHARDERSRHSVRPKPREAYAASDARSQRQTASFARLLVEAAGGPRQWAGKAGRLARTLAVLARPPVVDRRLERLCTAGILERRPTRLQLFLLGADMLRYFIEPGARDYYESRGIPFGPHQLLRVLDDPMSMVDPVGLLSDRDTIVGHVLQVVHANPLYDLQLLEMFEDGLEEMERQAAAMVHGTHPRARTIGAIVEDPEYHARLLRYVRAYRADHATAELRRRDGRARESKDFVLAEETFGAMPSAFRYASRLPTTLPGAFAHLREKRVIDRSLCDPTAVSAVDALFDAPP